MTQADRRSIKSRLGATRPGNTKYTEAHVRDVKRRLAAGETPKQVAETLGCKVDWVRDVRRGALWGHVRLEG